MNVKPADRKPSFFDLIYLYGPPGSGKSSVGNVLAENLAVPFVDLDQRIEDQAGMSIPEIFDKQGEPGFRQLEKKALQEVSKMDWGVIALGGGALLDFECRTLVEPAGPIFCLSASEQALLERLGSTSIERPLLIESGGNNPESARLVDLLAQRSQHYASFTNRIETEGKSPEQIAWELQIRRGAFHVRGMITQSSASNKDAGGSARPFPLGYDVRIASALDGMGEALRRRGLSGPIALVTDQNVAEFYLARAVKSLQEIGYSTRSIIIPPGESSKTMSTVSYLWQEFLEAGLERKSTVVALGGGVVGDLSGFAAATYMRGVPWINAPTSLLAGKNLVGAFHAPEMVLTDPSTLKTLPQAELRSGIAEVIKAGIIGDPDLFNSCARGWSAIETDWVEIIPRAMAVKIRVIEADPYEGGLRAALNFGHTIGHAVEKTSNYQLRHGEAVAIGMVAEARLAEQVGLAQDGLADEIKNACDLLGLPVEIPENLSRSSILEAMQVDKKRSDAIVRFALPSKIGEVLTGIEVSDIEAILQ
jgi:shikimate kinase/3-dehydroquinate synthase